MGWNLLAMPLMALARSVLGWAENSFADGKIELFEWRKLGETLVRMGLPILALVFTLNVDPVVASGIIVIADWVVIKLYNAFK